MSVPPCRLCRPKEKRPWIEEDKIVTLYRQAKHPRSQVKILAELNDVPRTVIEEILNKYGITAPPMRKLVKVRRAKKQWTEQEDRFLLEAVRDGASNAAIAHALGRSIASVKSRMNCTGINEVRRNLHESKNKTRESFAGEKRGA